MAEATLLKPMELTSTRGQSQKGMRSTVGNKDPGRRLQSLLNPIKMDSILFNLTQKPLFCVFTIYKVLLQLLYTKTNVVWVFLSPRSYQSIRIDRNLIIDLTIRQIEICSL